MNNMVHEYLSYEDLKFWSYLTHKLFNNIDKNTTYLEHKTTKSSQNVQL